MWIESSKRNLTKWFKVWMRCPLNKVQLAFAKCICLCVIHLCALSLFLLRYLILMLYQVVFTVVVCFYFNLLFSPLVFIDFFFFPCCGTCFIILFQDISLLSAQYVSVGLEQMLALTFLPYAILCFLWHWQIILRERRYSVCLVECGNGTELNYGDESKFLSSTFIRGTN